MASAVRSPITGIVLAGGAAFSYPALTAFCRERLPAYKIPREFHVVAEIARTSSGKLRRSAGQAD